MTNIPIERHELLDLQNLLRSILDHPLTPVQKIALGDAMYIVSKKLNQVNSPAAETTA